MALGDRRRSPRTVAPLLVAAVLLTACSEKVDAGPDRPAASAEAEVVTAAPQPVAPEPEPEPEPTPEPAAPERPVVAKPVPPESIGRSDMFGAAAAAQYFLELYPYVYATGDLADWTSMAHPECLFCSIVAENVEAIYARGDFATGGNLTFDTVLGRGPLPGEEFFRVDIQATQSPLSTVGVSGVETTSRTSRNLLIFAIGRAGEQWFVRDVQVEHPDFDG